MLADQGLVIASLGQLKPSCPDGVRRHNTEEVLGVPVHSVPSARRHSHLKHPDSRVVQPDLELVGIKLNGIDRFLFWHWTSLTQIDTKKEMLNLGGASSLGALLFAVLIFLRSRFIRLSDSQYRRELILINLLEVPAVVSYL